MNNQSAAGANHCGTCVLTPAAAWKLWHQLIDLSDRLWDAYEQEFLEFSIEESEKEDFDRPLPFE
jgi:hypothetical protein